MRDARTPVEIEMQSSADSDQSDDLIYYYYFESPLDLSVDINRPFQQPIINNNNNNNNNNNHRTTTTSTSGRLRYTCFDVTANFSISSNSASNNGSHSSSNHRGNSADDSRLVALGTTSGSVRVYISQMSIEPSLDQDLLSAGCPTTRPPPRSFSSGSFGISSHLSSSHQLCSSLPRTDLVNNPGTANDLLDSPRSTSTIANSAPSSNQHLHHYLTIIQTDLVGSVTAISFAPIYNQQQSTLPQNGQHSVSDSDNDDDCNLTDYLFNEPSPHNSLFDANSFYFSGRSDGNGHNYRPNSHHRNHTSQQQPTPTKVILAIGTAKGNLVIVELELSSVDLSHHSNKPRHHRSSSNGLLTASRTVSQYSKRWKVIYHGKSFTKHAITALKWDNTNRLFITDSYGQLFVLVDIESVRHLTLFTSPTLLLTLNGIGIHQIDIANEKLVVFSTAEQRVFLLNLANSDLCQIGGSGGSSTKKQVAMQSGSTVGGGGVCFLSNYRLVEMFNYGDSFDSERNRNPDYIDRTYRLISTECQLFCTRPKWRIWVVNVPDGQIEFTHQFSGLIQEGDSTTHTTSLHRQDSAFNGTSKVAINQSPAPSPLLTKHVTFGRLHPMYWYSQLDHPSSPVQMHNYLVTYCSSCSPSTGLVHSWVYVIDPKHQSILATSPALNGAITDIRCVCNDIFVSYSQQIGTTNNHRTTATRSTKSSADFNLCLLTIKIQCPESEYQPDEEVEPDANTEEEEVEENENISPEIAVVKREEFLEESYKSTLVENQNSVELQSIPPESNFILESPSESNNNNNLLSTNQNPELDLEQLKIVKLAQQLGLADSEDFDDDLMLFSGMTNNSSDSVADWKCHCGLPLPLLDGVDAGKCLFANLESKIDLILDNSEFKLSENSETLYQMLELAYCRSNWPVYMALLSRLDQIKFYLYFSILLDQPCLLLGGHYRDRALPHRLRDDSLWQDCFEFINYCALEMIDEDDEVDDNKLGRSLFMPSVAFTNSQPFPRLSRNPNGCESYRDSQAEQPMTCMLCQLKHLNRTDQLEDLARFYETRLLKYCLLYCSTETVTKILSQIMTKIAAPSPTTPPTTLLFSSNFYLLLIRFKILELSTSSSTNKYLQKFSTDFYQSFLDQKSVEKSSCQKNPALPKPGFVLNLSDVNCSYCNQPILTKSTAAIGQQRTVRLYPNCRHLYHSSCDDQTGSCCWLCNNFKNFNIKS